MHAMVYRQYGPPDVLRFQEVPTPTPGPGELLVQVHAAGLNAADWRLLRAEPFLIRFMNGGLLRPKQTILGADIAGTVAAVGAGVRGFQPGDAVFGDISAHGAGGFAEYVAVPEQALVVKPPSLSFEEAAAVPMAAITALVGLRDAGQLQPGQRVLIVGASGGVGSFAVQIARALGGEVTAVCSTRNVAQARALGASRVIDYTRETLTPGGQPYDLILAVNGSRPLATYRRLLAPAGSYVAVGGSMRQLFEAMLLGPWLSRRGGQRVVALTYTPHRDHLLAVRELIEAGQIAPVIERTYPLRELPEALRTLEAGHARGKLVITVAPPRSG